MKKIKFTTVTQAFAFCWKATYALNAKYHISCTAMWTFIQQEIYGCNKEINNYQTVQWVIKALNDRSNTDCLSSSESFDEDKH